jgi:hypothetical protein
MVHAPLFCPTPTDEAHEARREAQEAGHRMSRLLEYTRHSTDMQDHAQHDTINYLASTHCQSWMNQISITIARWIAFVNHRNRGGLVAAPE